MTIAVLGGTGAEGPGLSARLAVAGEDVIVAPARHAGRPRRAATLVAEPPGARGPGAPNCDAATAAQMIGSSRCPFAGATSLSTAALPPSTARSCSRW
jgi:predicted dinucleotide-binding enzyme